jgi:excisionase family DNA binding protein
MLHWNQSNALVTEEHLMKEPNPMLTPLQVATELSMSRDAIYDLIESGDLPAIDVSRKERAAYRIERADFEAFKAARRVTTLKAVGQ